MMDRREGGGSAGLHRSADALILSDLLYRAAGEAASAPPSDNTQTQSHCSVPVTAHSGLQSLVIVTVTRREDQMHNDRQCF